MADYAAAKIAYGSSEKTLLELLKQLMGIACDGSARDSELSMYLQMSGEAAEGYTNNTLAKKSVTERISKSKTPVLLRNFPYVDGLVVVVDEVTVTDDYEVIREGGLAWAMTSRCSNSKSCCFEQMELTYNAGYDPVPADLGYVIARTAMAYDQQAGGGGVVKKETVVGVGSIEYSTADGAVAAFGMFSAASLSILDRYRSIAV